MATTRIRVLGGSLAVTIPIEIVRAKNLKADELVEIEIKKTKVNYLGAFKGIGHYNREEDRAKDRE